jgi:hypothetical protein
MCCQQVVAFAAKDRTGLSKICCTTASSLDSLGAIPFGFLYSSSTCRALRLKLNPSWSRQRLGRSEGYGEDLIDDMRAALSVALDCRSRGSIGDGFWFNDDEAATLIVLLDLHEQQLELAEKADLAAAITESYKRAG